MPKSLLHAFQTDTSQISLPEKFTFPFNYVPHSLALLAAKELQAYLSNNEDWFRSIGGDSNFKGKNAGKMFGVLVVQTPEKKLKHLWAISGKLSDQNIEPKFVPPIVDLLTKDGFYKEEETQIVKINQEIESLVHSSQRDILNNELSILQEKAKEEIAEYQQQMKEKKLERKKQRVEAQSQLSPEECNVLDKSLNNESRNQKRDFSLLKKMWHLQTENQKEKILQWNTHLQNLKQNRKEKSKDLQQKIFDQFQFSNANCEFLSLTDCFKKEVNPIPPSGAGDCAAPKLLQFAFKNQLKPIAMAEFWWGAAPESRLRIHKNFYPACKGKCKPILMHMLQGLDVEKDPLLARHASAKDIKIIYEDDAIVAIHKPVDLLSVPGRKVEDSVYTRVKALYPEATGPIVVHRLDMSTSGILLCAKTKEAHENLQKQFIDKSIKKRYIALLNGELAESSGEVDLPLILDWENRPQQMVSFSDGKSALTRWELIEVKEKKSKIYFYPITGRTHQLRVHAAHVKGLNTPIVGDKLYGYPSGRLHLHAERISFKHPITREEIVLQCESEF